MKRLKSFVNAYKLETALTLLMLSWLSNGLFLIAFILILGTYYNSYIHRKPRVPFYDYRGTRVVI